MAAFGWKLVYGGRTPPTGQVVRPGERLSSGRMLGLGAQHIDTKQGQQLFSECAIITGSSSGEIEIWQRVGLRHIEAAIGREAIEQGAGKGAGFAEATGAYIVHFVTKFAK